MNQVGSFGRHAPVAIVIARHDAILQGALQEVHVVLQERIVLLHGIHIVVTTIEHEGSIYRKRPPSHIIAANHPIAGCHVGNHAIVVLRIPNVLQPLVIEFAVIYDEILAVASHGVIAQPAHSFVALRAVRGHTMIVADDAPIGILVQLIEELVVTPEGALVGHLVVDDQASDVRQFRLYADAADFHKAEALIGELRLVSKRAV